MTCRRCTSTQVAHYHNDLFDGWFCPRCVSDLVNEYVESVELPALAAATQDGGSFPPSEAS